MRMAGIVRNSWPDCVGICTLSADSNLSESAAVTNWGRGLVGHSPARSGRSHTFYMEPLGKDDRQARVTVTATGCLTLILWGTVNERRTSRTNKNARRVVTVSARGG